MANQYSYGQANYPPLYYTGFQPGMFPTIQEPQPPVQSSTSKSKVKDEELGKIVQAIENLRNPEKREEVRTMPILGAARAEQEARELSQPCADPVAFGRHNRYPPAGDRANLPRFSSGASDRQQF